MVVTSATRRLVGRRSACAAAEIFSRTVAPRRFFLERIGKPADDSASTVVDGNLVKSNCCDCYRPDPCGAYYYPSFRFELFLSPAVSRSLILSEPDGGSGRDDDDGGEDSPVVRADSVKKKRKRKMNKHKLGKLRKRLRRKT